MSPQRADRNEEQQECWGRSGARGRRAAVIGAVERRQRHNKHYESRPASRADFIDRWGNLCDMTNYSTSWKQLTNPISYQPILMPEAPTPP
eukprot:COSAG06_NODE_14334_length_1165_cov_4.727955_1_plen_91_part_00